MSNQIIADTDTPDPWMVAAHNRFYLTFTCGDRVEIWMSHSMENFRNCKKIIAWKPPPATPWVVDIWAPELHYLEGKWYIYFCGAHPEVGNPSHRTLLLRSRSQDPMEAGAWEFLGQMKGLPDHWNIDATVFYLPRTGKLYCCYSGWPLGDYSDRQQDLFLIELENPELARAETLTCISRAELPWERADGGTHGVNEGPTFVSIPGFEGIIYSANGSWTSDYRLAVLELVDGADPLKESSWRKRPTPLLISDGDKGGPFGPGHASFIASPYGDGRVYCIYHATEHQGQGWSNRKARVLMFGPEHFHPRAQPMCCALSVSGQWSGGVSASHSGGRARNVSEQGAGASSPHVREQRRASLVDKLGGSLWKKLRAWT
ncbi:hypothetical protein Z517_03448 [Fonsecaea pedrosoi CBS 271.37]|uniref:Uncharacterized protein n=1 Tax=Fonsecaea pedrosoi CBS 271.37 TaxID=1442368 RepID=A0A0D2HIB0_9EURO|nr:uncharacterized protein Z517_03448 [Fonsecaea pedrosoi CBS 271.37]KIW84199.1 hypothetical protein Z517_03448 [Fonsecaea pedrosoi CBS 271.37]